MPRVILPSATSSPFSFVTQQAKGFLKQNAARFSKLRHEVAWVAVGQALAFAGSFGGIKLLTKSLGPSGYGNLALGMTIAGVLNMFIYGPLGNTVVRYYSVYREKKLLPEYFFIFRKCHLWLGVGILIAATLCALGISYWESSGAAAIFFISAVFGIIAGFNTSFLSLQGAIRQRKIVALHQAADSWLRPILALVAIFLIANRASSALIGFCAGTLAVTVSQFFFAQRNAGIHHDWLESEKQTKIMSLSEAHELRRYTTSFMAFAGFASVNLYADRWIIQSFFGAKEVGIYTALYQIANAPLILLLGVISQFIVPIIYDRAGAMVHHDQGRRSSRLLHQTVMGTGVFLVGLTGVAFLFGKPIVRFLTTPQFADYHALLWVFVLGLALFQIGQLIATKGLYYNKPSIYFYPKLMYALIFLVSGFSLVKRYGLTGMAWATVVSALVHLLCILQANKKCSTQQRVAL